MVGWGLSWGGGAGGNGVGELTGELPGGSPVPGELAMDTVARHRQVVNGGGGGGEVGVEVRGRWLQCFYWGLA